MSLTNIDLTLLALTALLVGSACLRGITKELLHTVIFSIAMVAGAIFMGQTNPNPMLSVVDGDTPSHTAQATQAAFLAMNLAYYALAAYLLTGVLIRLLAPIMMKSMDDIGIRNRLFSGLIALTKITVTAVLIHVWYIAHAPEPHPTRLLSLPETLQNSELLQLSDAETGWASQTANVLQTYGLLSLPVQETIESDQP